MIESTVTEPLLCNAVAFSIPLLIVNVVTKTALPEGVLAASLRVAITLPSLLVKSYSDVTSFPFSSTLALSNLTLSAKSE